MRIHVHIQQLVLHGFSPADRHAIADAVSEELGALLARDAGLPRSQDVRHADGGAFTLQHGTRAMHTGAHIARAIHSSLPR